MKYLVASITLIGIIAGIGTPPAVVFAQQQPTQQQINSTASSQVRQRFNPNARIQGGNTIRGIRFTGVGGAIAGCLDVGGKIVNGISNLFPKKTPNVDPKKVSNFNFSTGTAANQAVPVTSPSTGVGGKSDNFTILQKTMTAAEKREACLDGVAYAVARGMLQQVTNRIMNWANNGFGGDPLYVTNLNAFLKRQSDRQIRQFLNDVPRRDPIFGNAIRSAVTYSVTGVRDGLMSVVMDTQEARDYQEFQDDFRSGGWAAFLNPANDPLNSAFREGDRLGRAVSTEQQNTREELQRNNGFLDMKFCVEYEELPSNNRPICEELEPWQREQVDCLWQSEADALASQEPECLEWESVTPGSVIASQVSDVTGSAVRQLEQADEINEVLGAFFDQALSNLISKGLASLGDKRNKNFRSIGMSYDNVNGVGSGADAADGIDAFGYQEADGRTRLVDFDVSRPQQLRAILQAQKDYLNRMLDARVALVRVVPTLGALDYCIPGPNPTWKDNLDDNADTYFGSLQEVQRDSSVFNRIVQSLPLIGGLFSSNRPNTIAAVGVSLFDKVSDGPIEIRDTVYHRRNNNTTEYLFNNVQWRYNEVLNYYNTNYTKQAITNAFTSIDPTNAAFISGFIDDAFAETANLPSYAAGTAELDEYYAQTDGETRETIRELEAIYNEVNTIVATAKARYIRERAAAGNPVVLSCINRAYTVDTTPVVPVARQENDNPSPFYSKFIEASNYFYTQL